MEKIVKIYSKINDLKKDFVCKRHFWGILSSVQYVIAPYIGNSKRKHQAVLKVLESDLKNLIDLYSVKKDDEDLVIGDDVPVWVLWWQGESDMPDVVRGCYRSLINHAGKHTVILLSKNNLSEYTDIPQYIYEKMDKGIITFTHFSDIVRMSLLRKYGGIWMDSTIFVTQDIKGFNTSFFSIRQHKKYKRYVCGGNLWTAYMIASTKGNVVADFVYQAFLLYWQKYNCLIDYYLIDYVLALAYFYIPAFKKCIDKCGYEYECVYELAAMFDDSFDQNLLSHIQKIPFNKLNWRKKIVANTIGDYVLNGK